MIALNTKNIHDAAFVEANWSYDRYLSLPNDNNRYEVIGGGLYMAPAPLFEHQEIIYHLVKILGNWVDKHNMGIVRFSPISVVFSDVDVVEPDIVYIRRDRLNIISSGRIMGSPDMIIEVLSRGNRDYDMVVKRGIYERYGVGEYVVVDVYNEEYYHWVYEGDGYVKLSGGNFIEFRELGGFRVDMQGIFREVRRWK